MPVYDLNERTSLEPEYFARLLRERDQSYDPLEELLRLERELNELERQYQAKHNEPLSSAEFYERYRNGEMGDAIELVRWAGRYRLYKNLKDAISSSLEMVLTERVVATS